jgi:hypothetical protein
MFIHNVLSVLIMSRDKFETRICNELRSTVAKQNLIDKEIKSRLNSDNACYRSVQNILSSRLLSKSIKIKIDKL